MPLDNNTRELAKDLVKFLHTKLKFNAVPKIKFRFDDNNAANPLGMTGHYSDSDDEIVIYAANRHPKDVLRSLAHELFHHHQKCQGRLGGDKSEGAKDPNYILHDDYLKGIEHEAFGEGNILFREWEAGKKEDKSMKKLNEMKDSDVVKAHKQGKKLVNKGVPKDIAYGTAMNQVKRGEIEEEVSESEQLDEATEPTVNVNPAITNSNTYIPSDRAMADAYNARDEKVYNQLLKKFGIKK